MAVTRFAPSPTGYLHIGGARTAIFNWLWARHTGGKFILRIEDTDTKRNTPTAMQQVIRDLRWLGLDWDEGPEIGGDNGPYMQSQRVDIYDEYIEKLLEAGRAYYCFDTSEELEQMRKQAAIKKENFRYPRPEKFPDEQDIARARDEGRPVTVRFAMERDRPIVINDIVRGEVKFEAGQTGDFIIRKSDGMPTYNFAVVIDDHLMGVTDVIRGQEHLMNTPGQQALQDALGLSRPNYAHMSVTVSAGGGKLSKRERPETLRKAMQQKQDIDLEGLADAAGISVEKVKKFVKADFSPDMPVIDAMAEYLGIHLPEINVVDFFRSGYLPEAVANFVSLLGWTPGDDREIMRRDEVIEAFDISRITKSNSLFDRKKLVAFNTEHMKMVDEDTLLGHFKEYLNETGSPVLRADDDTLRGLLKITEGARTLAEVETKCSFLFLDEDELEYDPKAVKKVLLKKRGLEMLGYVRQRLAGMEQISEQSLEAMLRSLAEEKEVGLGKVAQPVRVAITGTTISPPIFESVRMLGKERTLARMDRTIEKFGEKAGSDCE